VFAPPAAQQGNNPTVQGTLTLNDSTGRVRMDPARVTLTIPLRIEPKEFTFEEVRVLLNEPEKQRGRFSPRNETEKVRIQASKTLELILSGLDAAELARWGRENCLLIATVPEDWTTETVITPKFVVTRGDFLEERDFRVIFPPPISVEAN
jgi:hypothetical protein